MLESRTRVHRDTNPDRLGWVMPAGSTGFWSEELHPTRDELVPVFLDRPRIDDGGWVVVWWGPDRMQQRRHHVDSLFVVAPPPVRD